MNRAMESVNHGHCGDEYTGGPVQQTGDWLAGTGKMGVVKMSTTTPTKAYINLVKFDANGYPMCEEHGAMNCVNEERSLWRCTACHIGVDFGDVNVFDEWVRRWTQATNLDIRRRGL